MAIPKINNSFYNDIGERWYTAWDDPVALLRAEGRLIHPWVETRIRKEFPTGPAKILDLGCGAGFLANRLSAQGHNCMGVDLSPSSLRTARRHDSSGKTNYHLADAHRLPFRSATFHVIVAMDFLEHVENPAAIIAEAARVLQPGGLFFFHTFNRSILSWLVAIKGLEWFVPNTPKRMHVFSHFITPQEITHYCKTQAMEIKEFTGIRPKIASWAFWKLLATRQIPREFEFGFTSSLAIGYLGQAQKSLA